VKKNSGSFWLVICIAVYILIFSGLCLLRHLSSYLGDPDCSIFNQSFYTALKYGMPFYNSFEGNSHFAIHCSPIFYLLLPLYALSPGVPILLILQTCALGLGAWPVYLIAREILTEQRSTGIQEKGTAHASGIIFEKAPLFFAVLYLLYHPLHGINYDQFNELSFAVLPLAFAVYFFLRRRMLPFWICMTMVLLCKEDASFIFVFFGLYIVFLSFTSDKSWKFRLNGCAMILVGIFYLYSYIYLFLPALGRSYGFFSERYAVMGSSLPEVIKTILTRPSIVLGILFQKAHILYFFEMFLPLAFMPFIAPGFLWMTIPEFAINMLSQNAPMSNTGGRYSAYLIPFIFTAAVFAFRKLVPEPQPIRGSNLFKPWQAILRSAGGPPERASRLFKVLFIMTILCTLFINNTPLRIGFKIPGITTHQRTVLKLAGKIPKEASVSTQVDIFQHLSCRLHAVSGFSPSSDFILVDETSKWFRMQANWDTQLPEIIKRGWYEKVFDQDGIRLYVNRCSKFRDFKP